MPRRSMVFAAACIGMLFFGVALLSMGALLPAIAERFSLDGVQSGALVSLLPFGVLAGSVVFGPVVDRFGYRLLLAAGALLMIAGLEALAFASSLAWLRTAIVAIGVGGGILNGGTNALVADISAGERGAQLSLLGVFFGLGALGMPVLLGTMQGLSYALVLSRIGVVLLAPVIFLVIIEYPRPKQAQGFPLAKGVGLLGDGTLLLIAFTLALQSGLEGAVNNWSTTYLQSARHSAARDALLALSAFVGGMTVARLALAGILRRLSGGRVIYLGMALTAAGIGMLGVAPSAGVAAAALTVMGVGLAAAFPLLLGYVADLYPALSGTAFSVALAIALLGNMGINYVAGVVADRAGIAALPLLLGVCLLLQLALAAAALRAFERRTRATSS